PSSRLHSSTPSFPTRRSSDLAKELKKLGAEVADIRVFPTPNHDAALSAKIEKLMSAGLAAEEKSDYPAARDAYIAAGELDPADPDRKSTRLNSSHDQISYAVF